MEAGALIRAPSKVLVLVGILVSFFLTPGLSPASTCLEVSVEFSGTAASQTCSPKHILRFGGVYAAHLQDAMMETHSPHLRAGEQREGGFAHRPWARATGGRSAAPGLPLFLEKGWAWGQAFTPRPSGAAWHEVGHLCIRKWQETGLPGQQSARSIVIGPGENDDT